MRNIPLVCAHARGPFFARRFDAFELSSCKFLLPPLVIGRQSQPHSAMDADVLHLERALEAVKARSTRALANEESYLARIKELERMNRALVTQVASLGPGREFGHPADGGGVEATGTGVVLHENGGSSSQEGSPRRPNRTPSYKSMRDKTNRLSVERGGAGHRHVGGVGPHESERRGNFDSPSPSPPPTGGSPNGSGSDGTGSEDVGQLADTLASHALEETQGGTHSALFDSLENASGEKPIHNRHLQIKFNREDSDTSLFSANGDAGNGLNIEKKSPFQLLLCNDDGCEVREPTDRAIRHAQIGTPHSQFAWLEPPKNVLVVKKPNDKNTTTALVAVIDILKSKNIKPWVEPAVHWETGVGITWSLEDDPRLDKKIDFIICLGGDGTILWVSNLFPKAVPPVISFAMGSLGFLTAFEEDSIPKAIDDVVRGEFFFTPRSRLVAYVVDVNGVESNIDSTPDFPKNDYHVCLNEVVIDRGASAALVDLDVNIDGNPMTKVLADGVMISTPTGSTAYSLAAGGSMVHPGVSGVLFVPICPHTLSFRPLVLPDTSVLTIRVPETARVEPVASFDGKRQRLLKRGESLVVKGWRYPVPAICKSGETGDWFRAVKDSLLWNVRGKLQKSESS